MRIDIVKLCFGKALITGDKPEIVELSKFNSAIAATPHLEIASFGLFETSSPNYTTYYPDVSAEDLKPKEGDFIHPVVRALSEVIVHKKRNPIDFSMNGALHTAHKLLRGQTVNADHETALGNAMGAIKDVSWQDGYTTESGLKIPAGVNAELKIDGKSNPRIARGINMDPPSIHSVSVTVEFAWEKSHPLADNEFFSKLATFDDKGKMYKRNVTKVMRFHEISLVAHGADPFAQLVNQKGEITNPKYAHITYNSAQEKEVGAQYFFFDMATDIVSNSTIPEPNIIEEPLTVTNTDMKETILLLTAMAKAAGITISLSEDATEIPKDTATVLTSGLQKLKKDADDAVALQEKLTTLEKGAQSVTELTAFREGHTTKLRSEVIKNYKLTVATPAEETLTAINGANYEALLVLNSTYETALEKSMPLTCGDCKSHNISRATAKLKDADKDGKDGEQTFIVKNNETTMANLKKRQNVASKIHGVPADAKK